MMLPSAKQFLFIAIASILLGHFFVSIGRPETIFDLLGESWYYFDLFFVSAICFCVVVYIATVHYSLDRKIPVREFFRKRLFWQSLLGVIAPIALTFALTFVYMEFILDQRIGATTFFIYEFPISIVVILAINLVFVILTLLKPVQIAKTTLLVTQGGKSLPITLTDIAAVSKEGDYTIVYTFDQQQFASKETLEELEKSLAPPTFFRANRQWIVRKTICGSYETERSGKLILTLKDPIKKNITVSQKKAQEFKSWILT
jgi:hypothetical protein